jgi:HlyD family secretion protein
MKHIQRIAVLAIIALVLAACAGRPAANTADTDTTTVKRGNLAVTVSSSGTVEPVQSADLTFGVIGTIDKVLVEEGQQIKAGQELASVDPRDLQQQVLQSEANLQTAQARLEQAKSGNATEEDIAAQLAGVRAAQAQLAKARTGGVTAADIAAQQAAVRGAQANLTRTRNGTSTAADIANAEAGVRAAEARLQAAQAGPKADQVSAAQARLIQAQQSYQKTAAATSANKSSAEQSMLQAADAVRLAQEAYSTAYWNDQQAKSGIDPQTGKEFAPGIDDATQQEQYASALRQAELQLSQSQSRLEQAKVTFENAKQQEIVDIATAQSQVDDAQTQLDELLKGPEATDVAQAQAALDQARAQLQKLREGGSAADIAASRAQVDQATAQLQKLQQGGSAADIAAAQAQVDQANAQLDKLSAAGTVSDQSIAEAGVSQAEAQLAAAKLNLDKAVLRAPFDGIITAVNVSPGDNVGGASASGAPFTLVDRTKLHLDVSVSESDVAQLKEGQSAQVTIDALGTDVISGTVRYIAPAATVTQNVTTYRVRIDLPTQNQAIRVGMNATVDIATDQREAVLIVPLSAIRSVGVQSFVRFKQGEEFVDREVRLGVSNDTEAEVLSGLNEGDVIAVLGTPPTPSN